MQWKNTIFVLTLFGLLIACMPSHFTQYYFFKTKAKESSHAIIIIFAWFVSYKLLKFELIFSIYFAVIFRWPENYFFCINRMRTNGNKNIKIEQNETISHFIRSSESTMTTMSRCGCSLCAHIRSTETEMAEKQEEEKLQFINNYFRSSSVIRNVYFIVDSMMILNSKTWNWIIYLVIFNWLNERNETKKR